MAELKTNRMKSIPLFIFSLLITTYLFAQKDASYNTITSSFTDPLWKYVKGYNTNHWDTLKGYEVTFTSVVYNKPGVDGDGKDCDSTFNIYIKNNVQAEKILATVIKENPASVPPCINTDGMHVEVICRSQKYTCDYCKGTEYNKNNNVVLPSEGDSVAVTGRLIMDIHSKCVFEIHPAWNIILLGKSHSNNFVMYDSRDCETLRKACK